MRFFDIRYIFLVCLLLGVSLPVSASNGTLVFAVHPYKSPTKLISSYSPFVKYLESRLQRKVELKISPSYAAHIDAIGQNHVDFAYMGPAAYVRLTRKYQQPELLARQFIKGRPVFSGKIIARVESGFSQLSQLKGKRFAFGDPASTMSHLVPRYMLMKAGVDVSALSVHKFLGSHDNVALGVLTGDFDAGAVKEAVFYKYQNKGLKALATTPELSEHLFVATSRMKKSEASDLSKVLISMSKTQKGMSALKQIKKSISSLGAVKDADYDNLREILDGLKGVAK